MTVRHHPSPELLLRHAAGRLPAAAALLIDSHFALCAACERVGGATMALGGALLERLPPSELDAQLFERTLARLDEAVPVPPAAPIRRSPAPNLGLTLPAPLSGRAVSGWRWMGPGVAFAPLRVPEDRAAKLLLLRIGAGRRMPRHGHGGTELTLVLQGAFEDENDSYTVGDIAEEDRESRHTPVVTGDRTCVCLTAIEGRLRPESLVGRLVQPFLGL